MSCSVKEFFIGASTGGGYVSCCDDVFEKADRLYIIKGAPGTGKSRLMKELSLFSSEEKELFYCSSDSLSLDAVWFAKKGICITDGTAPHARDTQIPGAKDEIIDLGRFWDGDALVSKRNEIGNLMQTKAKSYKRIFSDLELLARLKEAEENILSDFLLKEKMDAAAGRLIKKIGSKRGKEIFRQTVSVGMNGITSLNTFDNLADAKFSITDRHGSGSLFCKALVRSARENGIEVWISRDPFCAMVPCSLYFPESKVSVGLVKGDDDKITKLINMERFIPLRKIGASKACLRQIERTRKEFICDILSNFGKVKEAHFALEKIYGEAMDFKAVTKYTKELSEKIFY